MSSKTEFLNLKKIDTKTLKAGTFLSETTYYKVLRILDKFTEVKTEYGQTIDIDNPVIEQNMWSANQFDKTIEVSRTELVEIFSKVGETVFTVNFNKQPTLDSLKQSVKRSDGKIMSSVAKDKALSKAFKGEERTLIGYLLTTETGFGRSKVIDLEISYDFNSAIGMHRVREVDHRSLNWLICKRIRYVRKNY